MTATIDGAFAAALEQDAGSAAPDGRAVAAPPRRPSVVDPDAPHGRAEDGTPNAPYGIGKNNRPRIKPAGPGRAPANPDDKPRTAPAAAAPVPTAAGDSKDYTEDVDDLADGVWMVLSGFPVRGNLKIKLGAQAYVLRQNKDGLAKGGNIAAQHHEGTAQLIEKLTVGGAAWILPAMFAVAPFVAQSLQIWRTPAAELAATAEYNDLEFKEMITAALVAAEAEAA